MSESTWTIGIFKVPLKAALIQSLTLNFHVNWLNIEYFHFLLILNPEMKFLIAIIIYIFFATLLQLLLNTVYEFVVLRIHLLTYLVIRYGVLGFNVKKIIIFSPYSYFITLHVTNIIHTSTVTTFRLSTFIQTPSI